MANRAPRGESAPVASTRVWGGREGWSIERTPRVRTNGVSV